MERNVYPAIALLKTLQRIAVQRQISKELLPMESLEKIIELAELYTKPSDQVLVYLELPLEVPGPLDVQFCFTESLRIPDISNSDFTMHRQALDYFQKERKGIGGDFAFDADRNYASSPCIYGNLFYYDPGLVHGFYRSLDLDNLGNQCCSIIERAPVQYVPYYIGWMQGRNPGYARIGFRHDSLESEYQQDISRFLRDLDHLGYSAVITGKMEQELKEASQFGFLQDTQLSITQEGILMDQLGMSSVYLPRNPSFSSLNLLINEQRKPFLTDELEKCRFALKTWTVSKEGMLVPLIVNGYIQYIKCTWTNGTRGPLKAYYALQAHTC